jgi:hypothetical protein
MSNIQKIRNFVSVIVLSMMSMISWAQDKGVDIDVNLKKESEWYQQTWVWILGGAIFVLLLVAILRGGSKRTD